MRQRAATVTLEDVDVECTHCGIRMTTQHTAGSPVRYFHCARCHRWVSSLYTEVFRADAKFRTRAPRPAAPTAFDQVKARLERWLNALDDQDPYRMLGVSPFDTEERVRERYLELAREHHPDRGGSADKMRALNEAYEKVQSHREKRRQERLGAGSAPVVAELPGAAA